MNLPTYNIGTLFDNAISSHPAAWGKQANAIADLRPNHSAHSPAIRDPNGFDTTPKEAIHEVSDGSAKLLSINFGPRIALNPWPRPTDIWPVCAASPANIWKEEITLKNILRLFGNDVGRSRWPCDYRVSGSVFTLDQLGLRLRSYVVGNRR